jgi:hypothetical protein
LTHTPVRLNLGIGFDLARKEAVLKIRKRRGAATSQQEQQHYHGPLHGCSPSAQNLTLVNRQRPGTEPVFNGLPGLILIRFELAAKTHKCGKTGFCVLSIFCG